MEREDNSRGRVIIDRAAGAPPMISTHEFSFALGELPFLGAIQVSRRERGKKEGETVHTETAHFFTSVERRRRLKVI